MLKLRQRKREESCNRLLQQQPTFQAHLADCLLLNRWDPAAACSRQRPGLSDTDQTLNRPTLL